jgi:hypothetical protein
MRFAKDESGAVTVDWVVLTAAVVGMVLTVFTIITQASVSVGANVANEAMIAASRFARDTPPEEAPENNGETLPD